MNPHSALVMLRSLLLACSLFVLSPACAQQETHGQNWDNWKHGRIKAVNVLLSTSSLELGLLKNNWGVNAVRAQIILDDNMLRGISLSGLPPQHVVRQQIKTLLDAAQARGLGVILDLHRPEGGAEGHDGKLWTQAVLQDRLVMLWKNLAPVFKDHPALIGYDLLNEPTPPDDFHKEFRQIRGTMQDWNVLAKRLVAAIREVDTKIPLIVETTDWAKPFRFRQLDKIDDPYIVYSFHMYHPVELTHQGVRQFGKVAALNYPGTYAGTQVNKTQLAQHMHDALVFAKKHQVPIFVGEFGINHFAHADARGRYIKDLLDLFNEAGWSWAFHAFQIWEGWMPNPAMLDAIVQNTQP
jgi:endoglucanase